jgi:hypothetical protein
MCGCTCLRCLHMLALARSRFQQAGPESWPIWTWGCMTKVPSTLAPFVPLMPCTVDKRGNGWSKTLDVRFIQCHSIFRPFCGLLVTQASFSFPGWWYYGKHIFCLSSHTQNPHICLLWHASHLLTSSCGGMGGMDNVASASCKIILLA